MKSFCDRTDTNDSLLTYIVDDNEQVRNSIAFILDSLGILNRPFASGEAFLDSLGDLTPGPVLLDIRMSGIDGVGVLAALAVRGVKWPVIIITGHGDVAVAVKTMKLGAIEFLEKPFDPEMLVVSLKRAFAIVSKISVLEEEQAVARARLATLTPRENDVVHSLIDGSANKIVAYRLGLSPRTVEMHRANAFAKLGLRSIADLIRVISRAGAFATSVPTAAGASPSP